MLTPWVRSWQTRRSSPVCLEVEVLESRRLLSVFTVSNTDDSGTNSLRWAINQANNTAGADTIKFNLTGSTTITPVSALPDITDTVTIDGTSQPGYNGSPLIFLRGAASPNQAAYDGLTIKAANCVVKGLVIGRFQNGLTIQGNSATGNLVISCYIGTGTAGAAAQSNAQNGVQIVNAANNTIGSAAGFNLISGNGGSGVVIRGSSASGNKVQNNIIGLNLAADTAIPNGSDGVDLTGGAHDNTVGGATSSLANWISGNAFEGVWINGTGTSNNVVLGNLIGTDGSGTKAVPNQDEGVWIQNGATNNTIGGSTAGARNVISGNALEGVLIGGDGTTGNVVLGNYIGLNKAGDAALPNGDAGVVIHTGAQNNTIGAGNVISGNATAGVRISGNTTSGNAVQGNLIGTTPSGLAALGNAHRGIYIDGAPNNTIGGTTTAARNVISANGADDPNWAGIFIANSGAEGNVVQGNYIGVGADGTTPLPQSGRGIRLGSLANNNVIGGTATGAGNLIGANGGLNQDGKVDSIVIDDFDGNGTFTGTPGVGNQVRRNSITENSIGINGIFLAAGANHDLAAPVLSSAFTSSSATAVNGTLTSKANRTFVLEFFSSAAGSPPEGQTFLGDATVTTDANGQATFTAPLSTAVAAGRVITATATNQFTSDTSEFSAAITVTVDTTAPTSTVSAVVVGANYPGLDHADSVASNAWDAAADPTGAAGPECYIEIINQEIALYPSKTSGTTPLTVKLNTPTDDFWHGQGNLTRQGRNFMDPVLIYDDNPGVGRFIIGDMDRWDGPQITAFDIAISKTSNPQSLTSADWDFYQIMTSEAGYVADYPGNLGYNADAFVFTLNMKPDNQNNPTDHVQVVAVSISDLVNGVPQNQLRFSRSHLDDSSVRPTVMHNSAAGDPMWLVADEGDHKHIAVYEMTGTLFDSPTIGAPTRLDVTEYQAPTTPLNPDGTEIPKTSAIIEKAAEANGMLVAVHSVGVSATQNAAQWYEIDVRTGTPRMVQQGRVMGPDNSYVNLPAIDINPAGDIGLAFIRSGTDTTADGAQNDYLSMWVTGRTPNDPVNQMQAPVQVPAGGGQANFTDGSTRIAGRSGITVDPVDGSFWASNQYTKANGSWGTAIANFTLAAASDPAFMTSTSFTVKWSGSDNTGGAGIAGYDVYVSDNGGSFTVWQSGTTQTSATFNGTTGHAYRFYSVATDWVGNRQATPSAQAAVTVDATPPTSSVTALAAYRHDGSFTVSWSGNDGGNGSGIASYDVYYSDNSGGYIPWFTGTTETSAIFNGANGHTYRFYSVAVDHEGNRQPTPGAAQATTMVDTGLPTGGSVNPLPATTPTLSFVVSWTGTDNAGGSGIGTYDVYVSDNGSDFTRWLAGTAQTSATFTGTNGHTYGFHSVAIDRAGNRQDKTAAAEATTTVNQPPPPPAAPPVATPPVVSGGKKKKKKKKKKGH